MLLMHATAARITSATTAYKKTSGEKKIYHSVHALSYLTKAECPTKVHGPCITS